MCAGVLACVCVHACVFVDVYERERKGVEEGRQHDCIII